MGAISLVILLLCAAHLMTSSPVKNVYSSSQILDLMRSNNNFSIHLYQNASKTAIGNMVLAPVSAYLALGTVFVGAHNKTSMILRSSLHIPDDDDISARFSGMTNVLESLNDFGVFIKINNGLFTSKLVSPKGRFLSILKNVFQSDCVETDFRKPSKAADDMNHWISQETNLRIKTLIDASLISKSTSMIITNTIYFYGTWAFPFNPQHTRADDFFIDEHTKIRVAMMYKYGSFIQGTVPGLPATFFMLEYLKHKMTMTIVIPDEGIDISVLEQSMDFLKRDNLMQNATYANADIYLPKFKIRSTVDLKPAFKKMGMRNIFSKEANFKEITYYPLRLGNVIQNVFMEVSETGTEAANATAAMPYLDPSSSYSVIKVNRPSLLIIRIEDIDLFIVRLADPSRL